MDFIATKLICLSKPYRSHFHPKSLKYSTFPGLDFGNLTINDSMRIIFGCMRPTETTFLPVLAGITPPDIRREARVAKLTETANNNPEHLLHHKVIAADAACPQRLVSRHPFSRHAARLSNVNHDPAKVWSDRVESGPPLIRTACPQPRPVLPPGADLPRKQWVKLNRLRCGTARAHSQCSMWSFTA